MLKEREISVGFDVYRWKIEDIERTLMTICKGYDKAPVSFSATIICRDSEKTKESLFDAILLVFGHKNEQKVEYVFINNTRDYVVLTMHFLDDVIE